jgi:hypothetical protein
VKIRVNRQFVNLMKAILPTPRDAKMLSAFDLRNWLSPIQLNDFTICIGADCAMETPR